MVFSGWYLDGLSLVGADASRLQAFRETVAKSECCSSAYYYVQLVGRSGRHGGRGVECGQELLHPK